MSDNQQTNESNFVIGAEKFGEKFFDMQEKCCFWNQLFPSGRKECTAAKMDIFMSIVKNLDKNSDYFEAVRKEHQRK
jgi:hypothetical protein